MPLKLQVSVPSSEIEWHTPPEKNARVRLYVAIKANRNGIAHSSFLKVGLYHGTKMEFLRRMALTECNAKVSTESNVFSLLPYFFSVLTMELRELSILTDPFTNELYLQPSCFRQDLAV